MKGSPVRVRASAYLSKPVAERQTLAPFRLASRLASTRLGDRGNAARCPLQMRLDKPAGDMAGRWRLPPTPRRVENSAHESKAVTRGTSASVVAGSIQNCGTMRV